MDITSSYPKNTDTSEQQVSKKKSQIKIADRIPILSFKFVKDSRSKTPKNSPDRQYNSSTNSFESSHDDASPHNISPHNASPHNISSPHNMSPHNISSPHNASPHNISSPHSMSPHNISPRNVSPHLIVDNSYKSSPHKSSSCKSSPHKSSPRKLSPHKSSPRKSSPHKSSSLCKLPSCKSHEESSSESLFSPIVPHNSPVLSPHKSSNNSQKSMSFSSFTEQEKVICGKNMKISFIDDATKKYEIFCITLLSEKVLFFNGINKNYDSPHEFSFKLSNEGYEGVIIACNNDLIFRHYSITEIENTCLSFMAFSKILQGGNLYPLYISCRNDKYTTEEFVSLYSYILESLIDIVRSREQTA